MLIKAMVPSAVRLYRHHGSADVATYAWGAIALSSGVIAAVTRDLLDPMVPSLMGQTAACVTAFSVSFALAGLAYLHIERHRRIRKREYSRVMAKARAEIRVVEQRFPQVLLQLSGSRGASALERDYAAVVDDPVRYAAAVLLLAQDEESQIARRRQPRYG